MLFPSLDGDFKNFFLAGTLKNKSLTIIVVPSGIPASSNTHSLPPSTTYLVPIKSVLVFVRNSILLTALMLDKASPLKPRLVTEIKSSTLFIFDTKSIFFQFCS